VQKDFKASIGQREQAQGSHGGLPSEKALGVWEKKKKKRKRRIK
jgi:hypothetical protein